MTMLSDYLKAEEADVDTDPGEYSPGGESCWWRRRGSHHDPVKTHLRDRTVEAETEAVRAVAELNDGLAVGVLEEQEAIGLLSTDE
ncbi:MAG: hypothetical protein IPM06_21300 [Rhizobiales bacterium]|nr:hypothetical protein [Hyphomicrobiales bacterium]